MIFIFRNRIEVIIDCMDQTIVTWLLTLVCAPHLIKNPYLTAKLVEVLFVISPSIQQTTKKIYNMVSWVVVVIGGVAEHAGSDWKFQNVEKLMVGAS